MDSMNARLSAVLDKIRIASSKLPTAATTSLPRLVAVSKTRPAEDVIEAYNCGQRHFGENYIGELVEKASNPQLLAACPDIKWHFIGTLQSNKANKVISVPGLWMVETIHSTGIAKKLNEAWPKRKVAATPDPLKIFIQVKTSEDEDTKSGCAPEEVIEIADFIKQKCPNLDLAGLMTIGSVANSVKGVETNFNPDFAALGALKEKLCTHFGDEASKSLELSMGMSSDYEVAIAQGATTVRVGSIIFGARAKKE